MWQSSKFCVNDQPNCCIEIELELPPCTDPCSINDLIVEAYDCTPNGVFYVDLDFIPVNPVAGSFNLYVDGDFYGNYPYSDLPLLEIGPFEGNGQVYVFTVKDEVNPDCAASFELESENCNPDPCSINDLIVEAYDCTPNGVFYVDLDFIPVNPVAGSFNLYVDGDFYGNYPYSDLPLLEIGPFEGNGQVYVFTVKDEVNLDCAASFELESENCIKPTMWFGQPYSRIGRQLRSIRYNLGI